MNLYGTKRFVLGIFVLILVDFIWVGSSELSKYLFTEAGFNKPFFSTYFKTSIFSVYLLGFIFCKTWRYQCLNTVEAGYQVVEVPQEEEYIHETSSLGEASYEPLKVAEIEKSSDSDDSSVKSVHFSHMTEVRHLSENEAVDAMLSRLSYSASTRAERMAEQTKAKFPITTVIRISMIFCFLWFLGCYGYQVALSKADVSIVNVMSSSSALFTLGLAALFPSCPEDAFTLSKLVAVGAAIGGTVLVSLEDLKLESSSVPLGVIWGLIGAFMYACYMVFLKRRVPSEDNMDFSMFFGFVGLLNMMFLWPGFFVLNAFGWETFEMPTRQQLLYLIINGVVGTVISELLWLWGCFLTSSLIATLSLSMTIPLSLACNVIFKGVQYSWRIYVGATPVVGAFVLVALITHVPNADPIGRFCDLILVTCCGKRDSQQYSLVSADGTEEERLIDGLSNGECCDAASGDGSSDEIDTACLERTDETDTACLNEHDANRV